MLLVGVAMNLLGRIDDKPISSIVECKISEDTLDARLEHDLSSGKIRPEQWFRNALGWYQLAVSYNNPYNHRSVHSELFLLHKHREELVNVIGDTALIFYGLGVGDTEIEIVDAVLSSGKYAEIIGVDVNHDFIDAFVAGLRNKQLEDKEYQIMFKGYHALFEQMSVHDFVLENSRYTRRAHICLGSTIGNFSDQQQLFHMFSHNCLQEDLLLLGFQLDTDIDVLLRKYSQNEQFARFVMNWSDDADISQLAWSVEEGVIKAIYQGKEVFRSKKYNAKALTQDLAMHGFEINAEFIDTDRNACVQGYTKM